MRQEEYCCTTYINIIMRAVVSIAPSFHLNHIILQEIRTLNVCASPLPASQARTAPRACSARRGSACQAASQTRTALSMSAAFRGSACVSICAFFSTGFSGHSCWQLGYISKKDGNLFLHEYNVQKIVLKYDRFAPRKLSFREFLNKNCKCEDPKEFVVS
jgi:hypothetical protein